MKKPTVVHEAIPRDLHKHDPWTSFEELVHDKPLYSYLSGNYKPIEINEIEKLNEEIKAIKLTPVFEKYEYNNQFLFT